MKKLLLTTFLCLLFFQLGYSQCNTEGGAPEPVKPVSQVCNNGSDKENLEITQWNTSPTTFTNKLIAITTPLKTIMVGNTQVTDHFIIGLSENGVFDFSNDGSGAAYPAGDYGFTVFSFNQKDLDTLATHLNKDSTLLGFIGLDSIPCCPANLWDIFTIVEGFNFPLTFDTIEFSICFLLPNFNETLNYDLSETYNVTVKPCATGIENNGLINNNNFNLILLNNKLKIELPLQPLESTWLKIYNTLGQTMYSAALSNKSTLLETNNWDSGVYIASVQTGNTIISKKIIK